MFQKKQTILSNNAKIKVAVSVYKQRILIRGKQMIDPRIRYANEPGFGACILPYFKANFLATFHQPIP